MKKKKTLFSVAAILFVCLSFGGGASAHHEDNPGSGGSFPPKCTPSGACPIGP